MYTSKSGARVYITGFGLVEERGKELCLTFWKGRKGSVIWFHSDWIVKQHREAWDTKIVNVKVFLFQRLHKNDTGFILHKNLFKMSMTTEMTINLFKIWNICFYLYCDIMSFNHDTGARGDWWLFVKNAPEIGKDIFVA